MRGLKLGVFISARLMGSAFLSLMARHCTRLYRLRQYRSIESGLWRTTRKHPARIVWDRHPLTSRSAQSRCKDHCAFFDS